ncbi:hypothetical protein ACFFJ4_06895 [Xanthomonas dyei]|uniref:Uncharacterized protein n=1 Tax=Xanthomonas dyei TaxID=743699 RepID=A0A2S7C528_9XANT|nr:hypothetical protein [Xanthomonas dyei]PPU56674.1 hypothetical protein XdyCFBP7245_08280 [Xanthomonas dyei]
MRHLPILDIPATFRRGKSVEQFLGRSPLHPDYIRHIELRPVDGSVQIWVYDVQDIGREQYTDLYDFPYLAPEDLDAAAATFQAPNEAIAYAETSLVAHPHRWVNLGVAESEYLEYIRAGRPAVWPEMA